MAQPITHELKMEDPFKCQFITAILNDTQWNIFLSSIRDTLQEYPDVAYDPERKSALSNLEKNLSITEAEMTIAIHCLDIQFLIKKKKECHHLRRFISGFFFPKGGKKNGR